MSDLKTISSKQIEIVKFVSDRAIFSGKIYDRKPISLLWGETFPNISMFVDQGLKNASGPSYLEITPRPIINLCVKFYNGDFIICNDIWVTDVRRIKMVNNKEIFKISCNVNPAFISSLNEKRINSIKEFKDYLKAIL